VRGEKGDGTVILTLVLYQCTAGACDGVRSGLSLSCNGQGGVKNPDSQGQCGSQKIMGIHKAIEEMVSMLLCHLFCQNTRSVTQFVWQVYLWTATFTPTARGDIIGPNKGGFLLHEGKA
jgi:hypothetical protein